jgi:hypothetical protein
VTGLNPLVQFVVAASSLVVAGAATAAYRRVSQFVDTVEQHERLLTGEEGTPDDGLVERASASVSKSRGSVTATTPAVALGTHLAGDGTTSRGPALKPSPTVGAVAHQLPLRILR